MAAYLLNYDLINEQSGFDYKKLWSELERLGGHRVHCCYCVCSRLSSSVGRCPPVLCEQRTKP